MASLVDLAELRERVKQVANVEVASNSALYTTTELDRNINKGLAKVYDMVISQQDQPYYTSQIAFNTVNGKDLYVIGPGQDINISDFYKLKGLDVMFGQNIVITARPFMPSERNRFKWYPGWIYSQPVFYQLYGKSSGAVAQAANDSLKLIPMPNGQFNCNLLYFPVLAPLVSPTDKFDGINNFEEWAVLDAARKIVMKQERFDHAGALTALMAEEKMRIEASLQSHDAENPQRVQDVTLNDGWIGRPGY